MRDPGSNFPLKKSSSGEKGPGLAFLMPSLSVTHPDSSPVVFISTDTAVQRRARAKFPPKLSLLNVLFLRFFTFKFKVKTAAEK